MTPYSIIITGPTASGKTHLAVALAKQFNGEIISIDSRQVFKGMDIGTGKDLIEYENIPYHLIDIVLPNQEYHLSAFLSDAKNAYESILKRQKTPIFCGGTPMWIHAILNGYQMQGSDPVFEERKRLESLTLDEKTDFLKKHFPFHATEFKEWQNPVRLQRAIEIAMHCEEKKDKTEPPFHLKNTLILAPFYHRLTLHQRVANRLKTRIKEGMIDEVKTLLAQGVTHERLDFMGLEYRYVSRFLRHELTEEEMYESLLIRIRKFVKRQDIWFRKFERDGFPIYWIENGDLMQASELVEQFINQRPLPTPKIILNEIHYPKHIPPKE